MVMVNMHEAKTHLSRLVERATAGEDIVIGRAGRPLVRLVAYTADRPARQPGALKGKLWLAPDFDDTPSWLVDAFEGRE